MSRFESEYNTCACLLAILPELFVIDELTFLHISEEPGHEAVGSDQNWIFLSTLQNLLEGASLIQERSGIDLHPTIKSASGILRSHQRRTIRMRAALTVRLSMRAAMHEPCSATMWWPRPSSSRRRRNWRKAIIVPIGP